MLTIGLRITYDGLRALLINLTEVSTLVDEVYNDISTMKLVPPRKTSITKPHGIENALDMFWDTSEKSVRKSRHAGLHVMTLHCRPCTNKYVAQLTGLIWIIRRLQGGACASRLLSLFFPLSCPPLLLERARKCMLHFDSPPFAADSFQVLNFPRIRIEFFQVAAALHRRPSPHEAHWKRMNWVRPPFQDQLRLRRLRNHMLRPRPNQTTTFLQPHGSCPVLEKRLGSSKRICLLQTEVGVLFKEPSRHVSRPLSHILALIYIGLQPTLKAPHHRLTIVPRQVKEFFLAVFMNQVLVHLTIAILCARRHFPYSVLQLQKNTVKPRGV